MLCESQTNLKGHSTFRLRNCTKIKVFTIGAALGAAIFSQKDIAQLPAPPPPLLQHPGFKPDMAISNNIPMELTTPLLESGGGNDNDDDASAILLSEEYLHDYAERRLRQVMRADDSSYCWRIGKSIIVILLSLTSILASVYVILKLAKQQPSSSSSSSLDIDKVMAYVMASVAIGVSICFVIYTEIRILCGHSMDIKRRKSIHTLSQQMTSLRTKNKLLTNNVEELEVHVTQYDAAVMKLRSIIIATDNDDIEQIVNLVNNNEDILHQIRQYIQQQILYDIVKQIIKFPPNNYYDTLDYNSAKELTTAYQAMITSKYGVYINTQQFVHALASNSTYGGVLCTLSRMLGVVSTDNDDYGKGDEDTAFLLPNNDMRQVGSIYIARAKLIGLMYTPLNPKNQRQQRQWYSGMTRVGRTKDEGDNYHEYSEATTLPPPPKNTQGTIHGQLSKIWAIAFPYYRENLQGRILFGILFLVLLSNSAISVYYSYLFRDFFTYLSKKDVSMFYKTFNKFLISLVLLLPAQISFGYIRVKLEIAWRKWLTERILQLYLSNKVYYGLERKAKSVGGSTGREYKNRQSEMDNPDQRIQQDISSFTSYCMWTFIVIMNTSIDLVSFSIILYHILPQLFIAIILFASMGTLITILVGKVLVKLNYESLQREADFRFILVRIRENAESIAFYGGEALEDREAKQRLNRVIDNKNALNIVSNLKLTAFTKTYDHLTTLLPIYILANLYFKGSIEYGVIEQTRNAFGHILNDLSVVMNNFDLFASFIASIDRLFLFMKNIQELDPNRPNDDALVMNPRVIDTPIIDSTGIVLTESITLSPSRPILLIRNLHLRTPDDKRILIRTLNLSLITGQNLLISGVSGAGKSSLLRAIAGLWRNGGGNIARSSDIYFLPQRPYCPNGTLRDQLLYPSTSHDDDNITFSEAGYWSDDDLLDILTAVDLPDLASRAGDGDPIAGINATLDWSNTLSLGEQQRLAFGRVLINRPRLVILDESTSALDVDAEQKMYILLKERLVSPTGIPVTYVSVGHRPSIIAFHDLKLLLHDGTGVASFISQGEVPNVSFEGESLLT